MRMHFPGYPVDSAEERAATSQTAQSSSAQLSG